MALDFAAINDYLAAGGTRAGAVGRLVDLAVAVVPGCDWAAVTAWSSGRRPRSLGTSSTEAAAADVLQYAVGDGPCLAAASQEQAKHAADLAVDGRWPRFAAAAVARTPVRGVLSLDLAGEPDRAVLNLYSGRPGALDAHAVTFAVLFAAHARVLVAHTRAVDQSANLTQALETSRQIGTAVGILMHVHKVTADQAYQLLVTSSQHLNRKLRLVAQDVTATGDLPST